MKSEERGKDSEIRKLCFDQRTKEIRNQTDTRNNDNLITYRIILFGV